MTSLKWIGTVTASQRIMSEISIVGALMETLELAGMCLLFAAIGFTVFQDLVTIKEAVNRRIKSKPLRYG